MTIVGFASVGLLLATCVYASVSDIRTERVPNRFLLIVFMVAVILDIVHYAFMEPGLFPRFALNVAVTCVLSLVLFYSHTWAGGDCKLACVLSLSYPASAYANVSDITVTLPIAIGISFVLGSLYLLFCFGAELLRRRSAFSLRVTAESFVQFLESYLCALACVGALYVVNAWLVAPHVVLDPIVIAVVGFCCIWLLSSAGLLRNRILLVVLLAFDIVASILLRIIPLGASPARYLFVLVVVLLRIAVSQNNYRVIPTSEVTEGMILATDTSMLLMNSRVKGLPGVSTEDLRSRLTEEEAASVRRWGTTARGSEEVRVVRKMPFAIFVSLGFVAYFVLWGVL